MPLVSWSDELSVGIEEIDEQHRQFINIMNELHSAIIRKSP
jgi:hemerythrin